MRYKEKEKDKQFSITKDEKDMLVTQAIDELSNKLNKIITILEKKYNAEIDYDILFRNSKNMYLRLDFNFTLIERHCFIHIDLIEIYKNCELYIVDNIDFQIKNKIKDSIIKED